MKKVFLVTLATILVVLCAGSMASAGWIDTFDTYANQAAFGAVWETSVSGALAPQLSTAQAFSGTQSMLSPTNGTAKYEAHRGIGSDVTTSALNFSFKFYDAAGSTVPLTSSRNYGSVWGRTGGVWTGSLINGLAIGSYNNSSNKYSGRLVSGTGSGWFNLDSAADRTIGWHTAQIVGKSDGSIEWLIDGVVGATRTPGRPADYFNIVQIGSGVSSTGSMYYDDVSINAVPEPGTIVAALALLGPAGMMIRRRRA